MRWQLRNQITIPVIMLILSVLFVATGLHVYLSVARFRRQVQQNVQAVASTLATSNFPMTQSVLSQMKGLSGADFVVVTSSHQLVAATIALDSVDSLPLARSDERTWGKSIELSCGRFYHSVIDVQRSDRTPSQSRLHVLYPEASFQQAFHEILVPALWVAGLTSLAAAVVGFRMASQVTLPLRQLQQQVEQIAQGDFRTISIRCPRNEVAELADSVNRMSGMLAQYEADVRRNERLSTLGQLGAGIAHQLRNSVTGCRIAMELHARSCHSDKESLDVALRQLVLMEEYLRRFLTLGKSHDIHRQPVVLQAVIHHVVTLAEPTARHVGIVLDTQLPAAPIHVLADADSLQQAIMNLVLNALEAASCRSDEAVHAHTENWVRIEAVPDRAKICIRVIDPGEGPPAAEDTDIFAPLVTTKVEGSGLGLTVVREIIAAHGGCVDWQRQQGLTVFTIQIPISEAASLGATPCPT